jgi:hypothetical protein
MSHACNVKRESADVMVIIFSRTVQEAIVNNCTRAFGIGQVSFAAFALAVRLRPSMVLPASMRCRFLSQIAGQLITQICAACRVLSESMLSTTKHAPSCLLLQCNTVMMMHSGPRALVFLRSALWPATTLPGAGSAAHEHAQSMQAVQD